MLVFTHVANGWNDEVTWPDLAQTEAVRTKCSSEIRNWNNDKVRAAIVLICQEEITLWWKLLIASRPPPVILCDFRGWSEAVLSRNMLWVQKQLNKRGSRGSFSWSRVSGNTVLLLCATLLHSDVLKLKLHWKNQLTATLGWAALGFLDDGRWINSGNKEMRKEAEDWLPTNHQLSEILLDGRLESHCFPWHNPSSLHLDSLKQLWTFSPEASSWRPPTAGINQVRVKTDKTHSSLHHTKRSAAFRGN